MPNPPSSTAAQLGTCVRRCRLAHGMTQQDLAAKAKVSERKLWLLEVGHLHHASTTGKRVSAALGYRSVRAIASPAAS